MNETKSQTETNCTPQIKICGLTRTSQALVCTEAGADAVGLVFYPRSPRHVSLETAAAICRVLPPEMGKVGVFVNAPYEVTMEAAVTCGLTAIQLHGRESPRLVRRLRRQQLAVIKALFVEGKPAPQEAATFDATAYLLECARGKLPGGNAQTWDWAAAGTYKLNQPLILAGGLGPHNVAQAVAAARPAAVDVSSGVESAPGCKDPQLINQFIAAVRRGRFGKSERNLFKCHHQ